MTRYRTTAMWTLLVGSVACSEGPTPPRLETAPLEAVPYEALGGGKVTFYRVWGKPGAPAADAFYTIDAQTRTTEAVAVDTEDLYLVAPNGSAAAVISVDLVGPDRLFVFPFDGTQRPRARQVASFPDGWWLDAMTWTPDSERLVLRRRLDGRDGVISLRPTTTNQDLRVLWEGTGDCTRSPGWATGPLSVGPGNELLFVCEDSAVYVLPAGATTARRLYKPASSSPSSPLRIAEAVWSPSGDRIAVAASRWLAVGQYELSIRIVSLDGTAGPELITMRTSREYGSGLCWMPDGSRIVFATGNDDIHLYVLPLAGGTAVQLTSRPNVLDLAVVCRR